MAFECNLLYATKKKKNIVQKLLQTTINKTLEKTMAELIVYKAH